MSRSYSILFITFVGAVSGACSVSARVPALAVGSAGPPSVQAPEAQPPIEEDRLACTPELGGDTGGVFEKAGLIEFGAIDGCLEAGDDTDGFLVHIAEDTPLLVKLRSLNDHGAIHVEVYDVDGGKLGFESAQSFETKKLRLEVAGETDLFIRLEGFAHGGEKQGRYQLVVSPDRDVAARN